MPADTIRIYDLARELNLSNKELIEKLETEMGVKVKSHSSAITEIQANRMRELVREPKKEQAKKPKAFIVKKPKVAPAPAPEPEQKKEEAPKKIEIPQQKVIEKVVLGPVSVAERKVFKPEKKEAPRKEPAKSQAPLNKQETKRPAEKPVKKEEKKRPVPDAEKKPIQRHMIPQDIYEGKAGGGKKKVSKKKEKIYHSKEEEQERISLEKASAQKHKKRTHAEEVQEEVKQVVINQPITVGDLAAKTKKAPAEIVKYLMMQGILATVNEVIDVPTAKKVCESFEIEVLEGDAASHFQSGVEPFVAVVAEGAVFRPSGVVFHFSAHAYGQVSAEKRLHGEVVGIRVYFVFQHDGDFQVAQCGFPHSVVFRFLYLRAFFRVHESGFQEEGQPVAQFVPVDEPQVVARVRVGLCRSARALVAHGGDIQAEAQPEVRVALVVPPTTGI